MDLLVVMNTAGNRLRAAADISAAIDHPFPIDILVYDPERLRESAARGGSFATEVTSRGIVLYEA